MTEYLDKKRILEHLKSGETTREGVIGMIEDGDFDVKVGHCALMCGGAGETLERQSIEIKEKNTKISQLKERIAHLDQEVKYFRAGVLIARPDTTEQKEDPWVKGEQDLRAILNGIAEELIGDFDKRIQGCEERTRAYPERNRWQLKLEELEKKVNSLDCERKRHVTDINILDKKIKALEDQHREIVPDPEKYECIDLGAPFAKVYILKKVKVKKPGEGP